MEIKVAVIFFLIGVVQGVILCDWYGSKRDLRLVMGDNARKAKSKAKTATAASK